MKERSLRRGAWLALAVGLLGLVGAWGQAKKPLLDKPIEIGIVAQQVAEATYSMDMPFMKAFKEKTNVSFKWELLPVDMTQFRDRFNIMVASRDMPDIMMSRDPTVMVKGGESGVFEELGQYLDRMPNYRKYCESMNPTFFRVVKTDEGKLYYFAVPNAANTGGSLMIRQDWLDKLGLKKPTTTDELYTVLKAFKEKDPNGNGKADEVPYTTRLKLAGLGLLTEPFGVYFYMLNRLENFSFDGGKVSFVFADPRMKTAATYLNRLYGEKLLDNEFTTADTNVWESRMNGSVSGMTWDNYSRIDRFNASIQQVTPSARMAGVFPLKNPDGKQLTHQCNGFFAESLYSINAKSKYKNEIVKLFDWMFSDEGSVTVNWGLLGDTYVLDSTGKPVFTDKITKDPSKSIIVALNKAGGGTTVVPFFIKPFDGRRESLTMAPTVWNYGREYENYIDLAGRVPTGISFTDAENSTLNRTLTDILTYKDEMITKFITGAEPLSKFDEFTARCRQIGVDGVVATVQKAYDRYLKR